MNRKKIHTLMNRYSSCRTIINLQIKWLKNMKIDLVNRDILSNQ